MKTALLTGIAALFLATGTAHAEAVYDDDWDWSGCKDDNPAPYDAQYYSCENGRDFEFFKHGNKRGYKRGEAAPAFAVASEIEDTARTKR